MEQFPTSRVVQRGPMSQVVIDLGIIGGLSGLIMADVIYERVLRPYFNPLAIGLYQNVLPSVVRVRNTALLVGSGTVRRMYLVGSNTSHIMHLVGTNTVQLIHYMNGVRQFINWDRLNLARWLATTIPPAVFNRTQRVRIWMSRRSRSVMEAARDIPAGCEESADLEDVDEFGMIDAFVRPSSISDSDTESEDVLSQVEDEVSSDALSTIDAQSHWGTMSVTSFDPRRNAKSSTPVKLNFPVERSDYEESCQIQQTNTRVTTLEAELDAMRGMIADLVEKLNKTTTCEANKTVQPATFVVVQPLILPGPPPPPPPPPPMPMTQLTGTTPQLKLKVGKNLETAKYNDTADSGKAVQPAVPSLGDLSKVKLKATQRSPGGTPLKRKRDSNPSDACSMITAALKKRLARMASPPSEQEDNWDKENRGNESGDSFDNSPLFRKAVTAKMVQKPTNLFPKDNLKLYSTIAEANESDVENNTLPLFGQHLLKPSKNPSASILKESGPLQMQNQNIT